MSAREELERRELARSPNQPKHQDGARVRGELEEASKCIYPQLDADGDHVHFEMVQGDGESLLWLTVRRGITPGLTAASLRKIADLIDRHGKGLLRLVETAEGPVTLSYDEKGDLSIPS